MTREQVLLEHAERVRRAYLTDRKLREVDDKIASGHRHLAPFRDRLSAQVRGER